MGELKKRGRIWWVRYYRDGRRHEESTDSEKKSDAAALLKIREGDVAKGVPVSARIGQLRFNEAADDLLTDYRVNGKRSYKNLKTTVITGALTPWFTGRRMASLTTSDMRAYVAARQEQGFANATINRELAALKRMFSLAIQAGKLLQRPHIPMLAEDNVRTGFFERAQFDAVCLHLPAPLREAATLAYYTGWRVPSELLTLEWHQIDRDVCVIRLEPGTTKNRDGRVFMYAALDEMRATIEALWKRHLELLGLGILTPRVFCRRRGQPILSFRKRWLAACQAAGCPGRVPHDFRRTAVRNLNRAGVVETVAMKMTGHKTRSVFDRYDITSEEDLADASRKLQALVGTISGTIAESDAEALRQRLDNSFKTNK